MTDAPHIQELIAARMSRRGVLGALAATPFLSLGACAHGGAKGSAGAAAPAFPSVPATLADKVTVPEGYTARTLIAWGDALFDTVQDPVDLGALDRRGQEQRFGMHNDMLALFPARYAFPAAQGETRYILCANHEYFDPVMAFPGNQTPAFSAGQTAALLASVGVSVLSIEQGADRAWRVRRDTRPGSGVNRRITPFTPVVFSGPAADHPWIRAAADGFRAGEPGAPAGTVPCGTLANCAGGQTPWGTYLTSEENFQSYFVVTDPSAAPLVQARGEAQLATDAKSFGYSLDKARTPLPAPAQYDLSSNPTGTAVYGWVVEIDPYDPQSIPRKRTAIGRKKGENAATALTRDGRVAVYQGDDQANEFVYKFVSAGRFDPARRAVNMDLLDTGVLYAARFEADGSGRWIALTLEAANAAAAAAGAPAFTDLGDVMVRARQAARLLGATPTDRPEDVEAMTDAAWIGTGTVLIPCTKNQSPRPPRPGAVQRPGDLGPEDAQPNMAGHVVRIEEAGGDCGAAGFQWDIFLLGGDPDAETAMSTTREGLPLHTSVAVDGVATFTGVALATPDNLCFNRAGHVFITTDGSPEVFGECNDMVLVTTTAETDGPRVLKRFAVAPPGAEICGPTLSFDERTFLCAVQHPGQSDAAGRSFRDGRWRGMTVPSSFPDGNGAWPRSAVVYIQKDDGGVIGT